MPQDSYDFPLLQKKQVKLTVPVCDATEWKQRCQASQRMPRTFEQLRELAASLYEKEKRRPMESALAEAIAEPREAEIPGPADAGMLTLSGKVVTKNRSDGF